LNPFDTTLVVLSVFVTLYSRRGKKNCEPPPSRTLKTGTGERRVVVPRGSKPSSIWRVMSAFSLRLRVC